ncbi:MAG: thioredoxin domain-containing protein, partial [Armatimonadetes bacterium]|nr:thioredoxin domain-containing protein [Anaerolineae bacterium]
MTKRKTTARKATPPTPKPKPTEPRMTEGASLANSKARAIERQKERQQQQRRQQILTIGGVLGVIALLALISLIANNSPVAADIPLGAVERYTGIVSGIDERGYPILGDTQTARVRVVEYASFSCPACLSYHEGAYSSVLDRVKAGEVTYTFVPMGQYGGLGGVEAAAAALCVGEQDQFWAYHDTLFSWQSSYSAQAFTPNRLRTGVEKLGLNVDTYNSCLGSNRPNAVLTAADAEGRALNGFSGTPTLTINGKIMDSLSAEALNAEIDQALALLGGVVQPAVPTATTEIMVTEDATATVPAPTNTQQPTVTELAATP